jgi:hypothetical protein
VFNAMSQQALFLSEIEREIAAHPPRPPQVFSEAALARLPAPVQRHLHHCQWAEKSPPYNARIDWKDAELKRSPDAPWMKMDCFQFNSVLAPARFAYMRAKVLGLVPFEGRDKTQDGHGSMRITLASFVLGDSQGPEMDASSLVTFLAESLLVPGAAVQPYIAWDEGGDDRSARATLTWESTVVHGTFHFNERDEMTRFVTDDRYFDAGGGHAHKYRWIAECSAYAELSGVLVPTRFRALWELPSGELEYFRGTIADIDFDLQSFGPIRHAHEHA